MEYRLFALTPSYRTPLSLGRGQRGEGKKTKAPAVRQGFSKVKK